MKIVNKVTNCPTISWDIIKDWEFNQLKDNTGRDVHKLKQSILNNGFIAPFDCWKPKEGKPFVLDGTGRYLALLQLETEGCEIPELPVLFIEAKNLKEAKKYALQKSSTHGQITQTSLADFTSADFELYELKDLALEEFSLEPLDFMVKSMEEEILATQEGSDDVPPLTKVTKVVEGDIFEFKIKDNYYRFGCGDSTSIDFVEKVLEGEKVDLGFNDPPYGMKKEKDGVLGDNMNFDDLLEFNKQWIATQWSVLKENGSWYCWGIDEPLMDIYSQILKPYILRQKATFRNLITWNKSYGQGQNSENTRSFAIADEKCLFAMCGVQGFNNNADNYFEGWEPIRDYLYSERIKANWDIAKMKQIAGHSNLSRDHWTCKSQFNMPTEKVYKSFQTYCQQNNIDAFKKEYDELKKEYYGTRAYFNNTHDNFNNVWDFERHKPQGDEGNHATPKPIALCERAIRSSCPENGLTMDSFLGSGSTIIACIQTKRNCVGCELDPKYIQVIINRIYIYCQKNNIDYTFQHLTGDYTLQDLTGEI